jgi:phage portal protein BeeE
VSFLSKTMETLVTALNAPSQVKFTPADDAQNWTRIQHLVETANTRNQNVFGDGNSAAFACLMQLAIASIEPDLRVWDQKDAKTREPLPDHTLNDLFEDPNGFHTLKELLFLKTWDLGCDGNHYWLKGRAGDALRGNVVKIWPVSPSVMEPYKAKDSGNYIDGYKRMVAPGKYVIDPLENVVHFRQGADPRNHLLGLSNLKRLVREIASDDSASRWTERMLAVGGAASMMVTVPKDSVMTPDQAEEMRDRIQARFSGENVGSIAVIGGGATATRYGFSPGEMDLAALHNVPETRICAVMGVHPAIALLGIGLTQTANFASLKEVGTWFGERKLKPLWKADEEKLEPRLLRDFDSNRKHVLAYDLSMVQWLQEDQAAKWAYVTNAWKEDMITLGQVCSMLDLEAPPDDLADARKSTVNTGGELPPPTPIALPNRPGQPGQPGQPNPGPGQPGQPPATPPRPAAGSRAASLLLGPDYKGVGADFMAEAMQALVESGWPPLATDLETYFDNQRRSVKRAVIRNG